MRGKLFGSLRGGDLLGVTSGNSSKLQLAAALAAFCPVWDKVEGAFIVVVGNTKEHR